MKTLKLQLAIMTVALVGAVSASAQVTVTFTSVSPDENLTLQSSGSFVFGPDSEQAGIYRLIVDGVPTPAFCIDITRSMTMGETLTDYNYTSLPLAPLAPAGPMGLAAATDIEKLWAAYFPAALLSNQDAAALQVAIWEDVAAKVGTYNVIFSGNDPVTSEATTMLASLPNLTVEADLQAVVSPEGQGYVVPVVPEPTTIGCFLLGLGALAGSRRLKQNRH